MASKLDYLQKYLADDDERKKKKKVKKPKVPVKSLVGVKIVDADSDDWKKVKPADERDEIEDEPPIMVADDEDEGLEEAIKAAAKEKSLSWTSVNDSKDISPPRKRSAHTEEDLSPPRKRSAQQGDLSPPRKRSSPPPPSRRAKEDISPPRKRPAEDSSPPRKRPKEDTSPPRRRQQQAQDSSPPRKRPAVETTSIIKVEQDSSPPRKGQKEDSSPPRKQGQQKGTTKMSTGETAGLRAAKDVKKDADSRRTEERKQLDAMDPSVSGKNADTVYRDRRGRKLDSLQEFMRQQKGEYVASDEKDIAWGKGQKQIKEAEERKKKLAEEASKPFSRYADDKDLDQMLKERPRWDDPMLKFSKSKGGDEPTATKSKGKESSENVAPESPLGPCAPPVKNRPYYRGAYPPNRFNIRPGYRWDGVDRSNKFEKGLFDRESAKNAIKEEAYLWSVEDM